MGTVRKIREYELAGGSTSLDIYPVTSTKGVFNENNENLDTIINHLSQINTCTSDNRPSDIPIGTQYFDTNLNIPIWWTGSSWVNALGNDI